MGMHIGVEKSLFANKLTQFHIKKYMLKFGDLHKSLVDSLRNPRATPLVTPGEGEHLVMGKNYK